MGQRVGAWWSGMSQGSRRLLTTPGLLQRERGAVARGGQPEAEACPATESRQQGVCRAGGEGGPVRTGLTTSPPAAHPVPHLAGAVKPDPRGEEKDVRHGARPSPVGRDPGREAGLPLTHPSPQPPDAERRWPCAPHAQVRPAVLAGAHPWPRPLPGELRAPRAGAGAQLPPRVLTSLWWQAPSPAYSGSSLYSPDAVASSGPIISDITELAPSSPVASAGRSVDERCGPAPSPQAGAGGAGRGAR